MYLPIVGKIARQVKKKRRQRGKRGADLTAKKRDRSKKKGVAKSEEEGRSSTIAMKGNVARDENRDLGAKQERRPGTLGGGRESV